MTAEAFARIPAHVVYDPGARGHLHVLAAVVHRSNYRTGITNGQCSQRHIATALGLSRRTVRVHLAALVNAGLVVVHLPGDGVRPTQYRLPWLAEDIHSGRSQRPLATARPDLVGADNAQGGRSQRPLVGADNAHNSETELFQTGPNAVVRIAGRRPPPPHAYGECPDGGSCAECLAWVERYVVGQP